MAVADAIKHKSIQYPHHTTEIKATNVKVRLLTLHYKTQNSKMILADIILELAALYAERCVARVYCTSSALVIMRHVAYIVAPFEVRRTLCDL